MTVATETSSSTHTGNGSTDFFATGFYFLAKSEVVVKLTPIATGVETVLTEGVHYQVTLPPTVGAEGEVWILVPPASGDIVVIERTVPLTQVTSFRRIGSFSPATHEDAFDRGRFVDQQLDRRLKALESAGAAGSVVAGDGVAFSGATLHVGAGDGIVVNTDDVAVDFSDDPGIVVGTTTGSGGISTLVSRADHSHQAATAAPAATAVVIGNAADVGASIALSKADHQHEVLAGVPVNVTKAANAEGVAGTFARSDHKHDVTTAAATTLTDSTNAEGSASSLARSDHTHSHGARGGGTLHDVATTSTAGFMSAADKTKLDGLASGTVSEGTIETTDATATEVLSWTPANNSAEVIELFVVGKEKSVGNAAGYHRKFVVRRHDNVTVLVGTVDTLGADKEDTAGWDVAVSISNPQVLVEVTGAAGDTVVWVAQARRLVVDAP